ncbi:MAG: TolC family protein [Candidatus Omnitrophota bacterium]
MNRRHLKKQATRNGVFAECVFLLILMCASLNISADEGREARGFSLNECVKSAVYNSFAVKKAKLDLYIAETGLEYSEAVFDTVLYGGIGYAEDKRQQLSVFAADDSQTNEFSAGLSKTLPTGTELSADISSTRAWTNTTFVSKNPSYETELAMSLTQPLAKNGLGIIDRGNISLTKMTIENAGLSEKDEIEGIIHEVEKAYIDLVFASNAFKTYEDMLEKAKALYEADKKNYELGISEKVDLLASEANLSRVKAEHNVTMNDMNKAEADLKLLMNMDGQKELGEVDAPDLKEKYADIAECLKEAFKNRRDYLAAKRDIDIKGLDLKLKNNSAWPEIDLNLSMAMNGVEGDLNKAAGKTVVNDNTYYFAGIEIEMPLENNKARSKIKEAEYEKEKALLVLKETERTIITEIGNAFGDVETMKTSLVYSKKAVELQAEKLKEEEKRFNSGRSTTKHVIDYQRDLLSAELENIIYARKYYRALADLNRRMNITLTKYEDIL